MPVRAAVPDRYHVHIQGVTGRDIGYVNLLENLNSEHRLKVKLEDIPDLNVPDFEEIMSNSREWRCTKVPPGSLSPVGIVDPEDPDDSDSSVDNTISDEEPPPTRR